MPNVNLFTNGILLGDSEFCDKWLPEWKRLGLTNIAVSVHSVDRWKQGAAYGLHSGPDVDICVKKYPAFEDIFTNIRKHGIGVRTTAVP